jgi:hypothetical protein
MPLPECLGPIFRARRRLNLIIVLSGGLLALALAATSAGLVLLVLELASLLPSGPLAVEIWLGLSLLGFLVGAAIALGRRLDEVEAAAWLDRRLGTKELLSAALLRFGSVSEGGGRFDDELLARVGGIAARALKPGYPLRVLARRGLAAAASCLAFAVLLPSAEGGMAGLLGSGPVAIGRALVEATGGGEKAGRLSQASARALADYLFPSDRAGADLALRALLEGRAEDFRNLLKKAKSGIDDELARGVRDTEKKRLLEERSRLDAASGLADEGSQAGQDGSPEGSAGSMDRPGSGSGDDGGLSDDRRNRRPPSGGLSEGEEGGSGGKGNSGRSRGSAPDQGGAQPPSAPRGPDGGRGGKGGAGPTTPKPGVEPGQGEEGGGAAPDAGSGGDLSGKPQAGSGSGLSRNRGILEPRATGGNLSIAPDREAPFFDYVLSGKDPAAALSRIKEAAARAAESAGGAAPPPLEYEQFIRSYFLSLAREAAQGGLGPDKGAP